MSQLPGSPTVPLPKKPSAPAGSGPPANNTKLVVLALVLGLVAVVMVNVYIIGVKNSVKEGEFQFYRLRVAKDVGQVLSNDDVELVSVPESFRNSFRDVVEVDNGQPSRLGDPFTRRALQNEPLTNRMFDDLTADESRRLISPDFRGVALPVVSKLLPDPLKAEMRVDLLAPVRGPGGRQESMVVMENVRVVSVGQRTILDEKSGGRGGGNFETLTVEVRPHEAVLLEEITREVQKSGVFSVLLRSPEDRLPTFIPDGGINPELLARMGLTPPDTQTGRR
ncbi:MAG: hypothetical protein AAF333_04550 [Planctomycetota bacterium]